MNGSRGMRRRLHPAHHWLLVIAVSLLNAHAGDSGSGKTNRPTLRAAQMLPSQLTLSWPTNAAGFVLESAPVSTSTHWSAVTNPPLLEANGLFNVAVPTTNARQFFRLSLAESTACGLTNGMVAYYSFDNTLSDSSGLGNNLTTDDDPYFEGGFIRQAFNTGGYVVAQHRSSPSLAFGGNESFSISMWVYSTANPDTSCLMAKGSFEDPTQATFLIDYDGAHFGFHISDGNEHSAGLTDTTTVYVPETWYHLVGVYDATAETINLWVNGVSNAPMAWNYGTFRNSDPLTIGGTEDGGYVWPEAIDEVVIWTNRALTSPEVLEIYSDTQLGRTPLTYCSTAPRRTTIIFNGDARFSMHGSNTNLPTYFSTLSWASNHDAMVVNFSGGNPPPVPPNVEQVEDLTNSAMISAVLSYLGPGTNVYWVTEIGINNIYPMTGSPYLGQWTADTIASAVTNLFARYTATGVKVVALTVYPFIGLENGPGDGTLATREDVRLSVNQSITNFFPHIFGGLNWDTWITTNHVPAWYADESEFNDLGNTNAAMRLNDYLNCIAP